MKTGKVKWFSKRRGYGFITANDDGQDIFVHYSAIKMDGYKFLDKGQFVQFEPVIDPRYPAMLRASNVTVI